MEGNMLEAFHQVYRVSLDVAAAQAADRCCACGRTAGHSYSEGGATDYRRTGVCEYCFDVLHDPAATTLDKTTECNNLTAAVAPLPKIGLPSAGRAVGCCSKPRISAVLWS